MRWPDAWHIACSSAALRRRPVAVTVAGNHLALYRDRSGGPQALEDRCAHRGAPVSARRVEGDRPRGPYHGWLYDGSGRVCEMPSLGAQARLHEAGCVRSFRAVESQGCVWV